MAPTHRWNMGPPAPPRKSKFAAIFRGEPGFWHQIIPPWHPNRYILTNKTRMDRDPVMNAPNELNFEEMLKIRLGVLRQEHRDLDEAISDLHDATRDALALRRLKKQKLALKDMIVKLEDQLIPDIIA